ncbi:MAG: AMP-binding protein, partial [Betaproteobacteria bacterium]|nr:AMP-binding protein [Betaproteobacteria bacterium]
MMQMEPRHFAHWPAHLPRSLRAPEITLAMLERAAQSHPDKPATIFRDEILSWSALQRRAEALGGYLQHDCGVQRGDRVLLDLQNGSEFIIAFFGILRADAVVVPVSPANLAGELAHYLADSEARVVITERETAPRFAGLDFDHLLVMGDTPLGAASPAPSRSRHHDLCLMPYTSGSTGKPKGCMHTHATVLHN